MVSLVIATVLCKQQSYTEAASVLQRECDETRFGDVKSRRWDMQNCVNVAVDDMKLRQPVELKCTTRDPASIMKDILATQGCLQLSISPSADVLPLCQLLLVRIYAMVEFMKDMQ